MPGAAVPLFSRVGAFLTRHQKRLDRITDYLIVGTVLLAGGFCLVVSAGMMVDALGTPQAIRPIAIQSALSVSSVAMIFWSGYAAFLIGLLSPFYSNLTRSKRVFLLLVSLLPTVVAALSLIAVPDDFRGWMIRLGVIACVSGGLVNVPAIVMGIHFVDFVQRIARKLHLVPNDSSPRFGD